MVKKNGIIGLADTLSEWASIFCSFFPAVWLYSKLPGEYAALISAAIFVPSLGRIAQKYFDTRMRFSAEIWTDRMVVGDTDSGRPPALEYFIRRTSPSFFRQPLVHIFRSPAWKVVIGRIDLVTGSVSVTRKSVAAVAAADNLRREAGSNEVVSEAGSRHLAEFREYLIKKKSIDQLSQYEEDQYEVIEAAIRSGVKIKGLTV